MFATRSLVAAAAMALLAVPAGAEPFRWAGNTDPQTMDPHAANLAPVLSFLGNIDEGMVRRDADMVVKPALATGWSPGTFDAEHPIRFLAHTPDGVRGTSNFGGYSNARIDTLLPAIQSELDRAARLAMLDAVAAIVQDEVAYVPLYVEPLLWATRDGVSRVQRIDNFFPLRWVTLR